MILLQPLNANDALHLCLTESSPRNSRLKSVPLEHPHPHPAAHELVGEHHPRGSGADDDEVLIGFGHVQDFELEAVSSLARGPASGNSIRRLAGRGVE